MSGLSRTPGKRVGVNSPPRVRIPLPPPPWCVRRPASNLGRHERRLRPQHSDLPRAWHRQLRASSGPWSCGWVDSGQVKRRPNRGPQPGVMTHFARGISSQPTYHCLRCLAQSYPPSSRRHNSRPALSLSITSAARMSLRGQHWKPVRSSPMRFCHRISSFLLRATSRRTRHRLRSSSNERRQVAAN